MSAERTMVEISGDLYMADTLKTKTEDGRGYSLSALYDAPTAEAIIFFLSGMKRLEQTREDAKGKDKIAELNSKVFFDHGI